MNDKISKYIVNNFLFEDNQVEEKEKEIILFGVTRIVEDVPKFIIIFMSCYFLNILKELLIVFIVTLFYKTFIGGAHARSNFSCLIISLIYFICPIMIAKHINYNIYIYHMIFIITVFLSIYIIMKIAPADTEEIPIMNKHKRKSMKIAGVISLVIISFITMFFIKDIIYSKIILYTILFINIFATRSMYKFLNCKFGIESDEFKKFY